MPVPTRRCKRCMRSAVEGRASCAVCLEKSRADTAATRAELMKAGICVCCRKNNKKKGYKSMCDQCLRESAERKRRHREAGCWSGEEHQEAAGVP